MDSIWTTSSYFIDIGRRSYSVAGPEPVTRHFARLSTGRQERSHVQKATGHSGANLHWTRPLSRDLHSLAKACHGLSERTTRTARHASRFARCSKPPGQDGFGCLEERP